MRFVRLQSIAVLGFLLGTSAFAQNAVKDDASEARMRRDITFLASDECEGRGADTKGIELAASYIAKEFEKAGLKPGGKNGSFFQPFTINGPTKKEGPGVVKLQGPLGQTITLREKVDFNVLGLSGSGKITKDIVFIGFGLSDKEVNVDDYAGIDVADKIVVVLRHTPRWLNDKTAFGGPRKEDLARLDYKIGNAETNKAAGVILVNDATEIPGNDKLIPFEQLASLGGSKIPAVHVRREAIDPVIFNGLGESLVDVEKAIDRDLKSRSGPITGWKATLETAVNRKLIEVKNVVGVLEGTGPLAKETVVVGAHYDHLGYGKMGGSLAKDKIGKEIHHGADDNGSGTTTIMELARRFASLKNQDGRRLVFMAFSGEELGLLGSRHYCNKEPLFPLEETVAMVNLDMVGRLQQDKLHVHGTGTAKTFDPLIDQFKSAFKLTKVAGGTGPSDHDSFYRKKVPVLFFFTGFHPEYHKPTDTSDKINIAGMKQVADMAEKIILNLREVKDRPEYVQLTTPVHSGTMKGPKLGIMPDYNSEKAGVLLEGVSDGGAASKGGLKAGDLIVEIAGKPVSNLTAYMTLMNQQRIGQTIEVVVEREGKKLPLKVQLK